MLAIEILVEEILRLQNTVCFLQAQLREAKMSKDTEAANKRIERILRPDMDAGEVDEIVNRIYRQEAEMSEHTDYMGLFTTMQRVEQLQEIARQLRGVLPVVVMEDEPVHTDSRPFCSDLACGCHRDRTLIREHLMEPERAGLLTWFEARALWRGVTL